VAGGRRNCIMRSFVTCRHERDKKCIQKFCPGNLKGKDYNEDTGVMGW
jgi:hypothetical protein